MFSRIYDEIIESEERTISLVEALTKSQMTQLRKELATPEILPCDFDVSIPGWIERIKLWGNIEIYHKDPENFRGKKQVTVRQFVDKLQSEDVKKLLSCWNVEKLGLAKAKFYKDYIGNDGKIYTEEFVVKVKLRKELRGFRLW